LSMQRSEQSTGPQPVAAGVPGAASNAPNSQALPVYPRQTTGPQSAKSESGTYASSKTVRHVVEEPGKVRRLTAAIVVNDRMMQPATRGQAAQWQPRTPDELRNLTALAQAAVGFDASRGDVVQVEDLAFENNRLQKPVSLPSELLSKIENSPILVKYVALLAAILVVVLLGVRPALRRAKAVPVAKDATQGKIKELPAEVATTESPVLKPPEVAEVDPERVRMQEIFDQVTDHLKKEPTQSSRLLQSWIHSD
jgi:flagellar M-ring protein FliF